MTAISHMLQNTFSAGMHLVTSAKDLVYSHPLYSALTAIAVVGAVFAMKMTDHCCTQTSRFTIPGASQILQTTALHDAVSSNDLGAVERLIEAGGDVNAQDTFNATPLHYAAYRNFNLFGALLRAGADHNAETVFGTTPLAIAGQGIPALFHSGRAQPRCISHRLDTDQPKILRSC